MDPYLEQFWPDVHASLIIYARDQLEEQLPSNLLARVEERIVFETEAEETRPAYPDIKIAERRGRGESPATVVSRTAVIEPVIVEVSLPETETYIHILEAGPGQRLVTVIEILSLANKLPGEGQRLYRQKQAELRQAGVNLVEIDLLRRGRRVLAVPASEVPRRAHTLYQACVRRGGTPRRFEVYPMPLEAPLPAIRIPLREQDQDIRLDLQAIVEQAYRKGRYHLTIRYDQQPDPPLPRAEAKWARAQLKKARKG
jgi:hypothetical protein